MGRDVANEYLIQPVIRRPLSTCFNFLARRIKKNFREIFILSPSPSTMGIHCHWSVVNCTIKTLKPGKLWALHGEAKITDKHKVFFPHVCLQFLSPENETAANINKLTISHCFTWLTSGEHSKQIQMLMTIKPSRFDCFVGENT